MIRETDAVIAARRETWKKALSAARVVTGFTMTKASAFAVDVVVAEIVRAALADGVNLNEPSP